MRYAASFLLAIVALTIVAVLSFGHISQGVLTARGDTSFRLGADTLTVIRRNAPVAPTAADYARFAAADAAWRRDSAPQYSLADLRARGDGRRTPREAMQDRVFELTRRGDRARATAELERWVGAHPRDRDALLSLARLLDAQGRTGEAVARYRQLLALSGGNHDGE